MSVEAYRELLLSSGVPFEVSRTSLVSLCERFMESARLGLLGENVNLVAATRPAVTCAMWMGSFSTGGKRHDGVLVLPRDREIMDDVRDALWVEGDSVRKPWSKEARTLAAQLEEVAALQRTPLGPRSTLCHQEKAIAMTAPGVAFLGRTYGSPGPGEHGHEAWVRVKLDLPHGTGFPEPSFLSFDLCSECGLVVDAASRLGLAIVDPPRPHRHVWTEFSSPVPDVKGVAGQAAGEVCLVERDGESIHPGVCLATRNVRVSMSRRAVLSVMPAWAHVDKPILRQKVLAIQRGHRHVWEEGRVALGASANLMTLRCVTCSSELWSNKVWGETIPELMTEFRRRLGRYGGFSRASAEKLREVSHELKAKWGSYLEQYADAVAMMACGEGLTDPTPENRRRAEEMAGISRSQDAEALRAAQVEFWRQQKLDDETIGAWVETGFMTAEDARALKKELRS